LELRDFDKVVELQKQCFPKLAPWTREQYAAMLEKFPEGQICIELDGELIASSSALIVDYDLYSEWHDWKSISSNGTIANHNPAGDMLYGIEIMVHPEYRGMKLARRLYDARKQLVRQLNLRGIVVGGRIPGYLANKDGMTVHEYVARVEEKAIYDPVLTTQLANGFEVKQLLPDYLPSDEDSAGWATHLEWMNVDFKPYKKRSVQAVQMVRIAAVQWQMRTVGSFEEFERQVDYFVDTSSDYRCDFVVFPELFSLQLLSFAKCHRPSEAARQLAAFTPRIVEMFTAMAIRYHINIVGGSHFEVEDGTLYNAAFLFRRDGTIERQYKIHVTPAEWKWWGVTGGHEVNVFDTDCGRVCIQICYDIEFPELSRLAAKRGAQLIFVPFNADERNAYLRVRNCAMARCVENHVYTVIAGCTGNLPQVPVADIHYAQSGIYTPADICFSRDAIAAESTANVETLILQELDLELLRKHRYKGTTRNWLDRRRDLYEVRFKVGDEEVGI
jgi:predicted amidohydrolase/ribosomal protein S18 acetylase RimI-like enzyme